MKNLIFPISIVDKLIQKNMHIWVSTSSSGNCVAADAGKDGGWADAGLYKDILFGEEASVLAQKVPGGEMVFCFSKSVSWSKR